MATSTWPKSGLPSDPGLPRMEPSASLLQKKKIGLAGLGRSCYIPTRLNPTAMLRRRFALKEDGMSIGAVCLAIAACTSNPASLITRDNVDLVEINHLYDEQGRLLLDQVIFYDWSPQHRRYNVRAWKLIKSQAQLPTKNRSGQFVATWHDDRTLRQIVAKSMVESWTQFDPELVERQFLSKDKRANLTKQLAPLTIRR